MARRGRLRKLDRSRWRPPPPDRGTPQIQELRQALIGKNDLTLTPLSALFARELITRPAHDAGCLYGALSALQRHAWDLSDGSLGPHYRRIVANGFGLLTDTPGVWSGDSDVSLDDKRERARARLADMDLALGKPPELVRLITRDVVLDQRWDAWVRRYVLECSDRRDETALLVLREGLRRLHGG